MPKENFWHAIQIEGSAPWLTVAWGNDGVLLNDQYSDKSTIDRLIKVLRKARKSA